MHPKKNEKKKVAKKSWKKVIIRAVPEGIEPSTSRLTVARSATELRNHFEHSLDEVELETTVSILQHGTSCMTLPRQNVPAVYLVSYYNYKTLWQHPGESPTYILHKDKT